MQDIPVTMLVDTGANVSILKKSMFDQWPPLSKPPINPVRRPLRTATGELASFYGKTIVTIGFGKRKVEHEIWLADIDNDGILGVDFLKANDCDLMLSESYLSIWGKQIPCYGTESLVPPTCCKITVPEYLEVPPRTEVIIPGKPLSYMCGDKEGIIEPTEQFVQNTGLLVAKSVVKFDKGIIPLRIANLSEKTLRINKCTVAATFEPIEAVENESGGTKCEKVLSTEGESENVNEVPEHLKDLYERSCFELDEEQKAQVKALLIKHQNVFSRSSYDLGCSDLAEHKIDTGQSKPIKQNPYRIPLAKKAEAEQEIKEMADRGIIEPVS